MTTEAQLIKETELRKAFGAGKISFAQYHNALLPLYEK